MDGIFQFLLIVAIVLIGIVRQSKKAAKKAHDKEVLGEPPIIVDTDNPEPAELMPPTSTPRPARQQPMPAPTWATSREPFTLAHTTSSRAQSIPTLRTTKASAPLSKPANQPTTTTLNASDIEEVRRAVLWAEILNRKY